MKLMIRFTAGLFLIVCGLVSGCGGGSSSGGEFTPLADTSGGDGSVQLSLARRIRALDKARSSVISKNHFYLLERDKLSVFYLEPPEILDTGEKKVTPLEIPNNIIDATVTADYTLRLNGTDMDNSETIASKGNYIYLGGFNLAILDNSSADSLLNGEKIILPYQSISYLRVHGDYLLASGSSSEGGYLFDISNPKNPVLLNRFASGLGSVSTSVMHGNYIYTFDLNRTLHVFDASNPGVDIPKVSESKTRIAVSNALVTKGYLIVTGTKPGDAGYRSLSKDSEAYELARPRTALVMYSLADAINPLDVNYLALSGPGYGRGLGIYKDCIAVSKYGVPLGRKPLTTPTTSVEFIDISHVLTDLSDTGDLQSARRGTLKGASTTKDKFPYNISMNGEHVFIGGDDFVLVGSNPCSENAESAQ